MRKEQLNEYVAQLRKLGRAYREAVGRFAKTHDPKAMQSAAIEMKVLAAEIARCTKDWLGRAKPK